VNRVSINSIASGEAAKQRFLRDAQRNLCDLLRTREATKRGEGQTFSLLM